MTYYFVLYEGKILLIGQVWHDSVFPPTVLSVALFLCKMIGLAGGCVCSIKCLESDSQTSVKITKQCLFCLGVHVGKVDRGNCPMIAFDLHNCTTGIVCAVLCLENIDFALYVLRNRINWFACFSVPLLDNKGHSVFSLSFLFFMHQSQLSCTKLSIQPPQRWESAWGEEKKRKAIC